MAIYKKIRAVDVIFSQSFHAVFSFENALFSNLSSIVTCYLAGLNLPFRTCVHTTLKESKPEKKKIEGKKV